MKIEEERRERLRKRGRGREEDRRRKLVKGETVRNSWGSLIREVVAMPRNIRSSWESPKMHHSHLKIFVSLFFLR